MKTLVAYYSRTGVTRTVAQSIADQMDADVEEIVDGKKRRGLLGCCRSVWDALRKKTLPIEPAQHDPAGYDLVIVGTPVWAYSASTPARSYLSEHADAILPRVGQIHPDPKTGDSLVIGYLRLPRFISITGFAAQGEAMVTARPGNAGTELEAFGFALLGGLAARGTEKQQGRCNDLRGTGASFPS